MTGPRPAGTERWQDAVTAAVLTLVDPAAVGGILLRARAGPVRDRFLAEIESLAGSTRPIVKLPPGIGDDRLIGGLDLTQTLATGRPVLERGVLQRADGGLLVVVGAERLSLGTAARICAVLDRGVVTIEREGLRAVTASRFGLILLDEGADRDETAPYSLVDRTAFTIDLDGIAIGDIEAMEMDGSLLIRASASTSKVEVDTASVEAIIEAADALGISSQRVPYLALNAARISAALDGRTSLTADDLALAARLVLGPRATVAPQVASEPRDAPPEQDAPSPPPRDEPEKPPRDAADGEGDRDGDSATTPDAAALEILLAAAAARLPAGLLQGNAGESRAASPASGRAGRKIRSRNRGARLPSRPGTLGGGARLDVVATLRAAAPFQALRQAEQRFQVAAAGKPRIAIRPSDIRIARYKQHGETLTLFAVDASGSSALHRLAEAKGAVELLLADCYARRDWVALVSFRGTGSSLLVPPTRSLTRAKRCLGELAGGGGTPLAAGLKASFDVARAASRQGRTTTTVVLTDGRANVGLDGKGGRPQAETDAMMVARVIAAAGERTLMIDTGPRSNPFAQRLAAAMRGRYVPLPHADSRALNSAVRAVLHGKAARETTA